MEEIKIRFKNGLVGYFELIDVNEDIKEIYDFLKENMTTHDAVLDFIDIEDNKRTLIRLSDISTFGYSENEICSFIKK